MIKSMTGFASLTREDELATIGVTARSVNHRYLDIQIRTPQALLALEHELRNLVQQRVARGRVELVVTLQLKSPPTTEVDINERVVDALVSAVKVAQERGWVDGGLTAGDLFRFPQVVAVREQPSDPEIDARVRTAVKRAVDEAIVELDRMRLKEGEFLCADLEGRRAELCDLVDRIVAGAATGQATLREKLSARVAELARDGALEPSTITQEVVRFVARSDTDEEVTRLRGHLAHWAQVVKGSAPCGRKLDFLLQEMNRETNTIGAKAEGAEISELIVAAKVELEKLREQTQNIE